MFLGNESHEANSREEREREERRERDASTHTHSEREITTLLLPSLDVSLLSFAENMKCLDESDLAVLEENPNPLLLLLLFAMLLLLLP